jgi:hypothetical protein
MQNTELDVKSIMQSMLWRKAKKIILLLAWDHWNKYVLESESFASTELNTG